MGKQTEKQVYLEVLRCVALLFVVSIHVVAIPIQNWTTNPGTGYPLYSLIYTVGNFGVPLFLMISGTLLLNPEKEISLQKLYKKMLPRILVPLVVFGYCFALMEIFFDTHTLNIKMFLEAGLRVLNKESWGHLWYLYLLIGIYLMLPILRMLLDKANDQQLRYIMGILCLFGFVIPTINNIFGTRISLEQPKPLCHITTFMMGYVITKYYHSKKFKKCLYVGGTISLIVLVAFSLFAGRINYECYTMLARYDGLLVFCASSMIFLWFTDKQETIKEHSKGIIGKYLMSLGNCSFGIYLIHPVIMNVLYKVFDFQPILFNPVISIPLFCVAFIVPCHLVVWVMKKIPGLRKLV